MKRFFTVIPISERINLFKDPGTIPVELAELGYDATFVSYIDVSYLSEEEEDFTKRIKLVQLKDDRGRKPMTWNSPSVLKYIWQNAKNIDILNLYYLKHSILYGILYKTLHPKGFLYLKLDIDGYGEQQLDKRSFQAFRQFVFRIYLRFFPDLISAETKFTHKYISDNYLPNNNKLILVPDGISVRKDCQITPFEKRENIILTVGRIGTYQKNNELLLEAAAKINTWNDWKVVIIGPIEDGFKKTIDAFYNENPLLKDKVIFTGPIYNREVLFSYYNKSKVFCLTSRYESFGIVYAEAQYFGNYIVSTDVVSLEDFIEKDNSLGTKIHDAVGLSEALSHIIGGEVGIENGFEERVKHGKRFLWSNIVKELAQRL